MGEIICYAFCFTLLAVGCLLAGISLALVWVYDALQCSEKYLPRDTIASDAQVLRKEVCDMLATRIFHAAYITCIAVAVVGVLLTAFL